MIFGKTTLVALAKPEPVAFPSQTGKETSKAESKFITPQVTKGAVTTVAPLTVRPKPFSAGVVASVLVIKLEKSAVPDSIVNVVEIPAREKLRMRKRFTGKLKNVGTVLSILTIDIKIIGTINIIQ